MRMSKTARRIVTFILSIIVVAASITIPVNQAKAAGGYWKSDVFTKDRPKKGSQSYMESEKKDVSNTFINAFIDTAFMKDGQTDTTGFTRWDFEGETYYFRFPDDLGVVGGLNQADKSVTVQLLVRYSPDKARLVEPSARGVDGPYYFSPNMSEEKVVKEYRAFMDFMGEYFSQSDRHIDCWVCGNEVNAPDMWNFYGRDCMSNVGGTRWKVFDTNLVMERYTKWYDIVYKAVKGRNPGARVCACLDHCWTESDGGKVIPTKTFLDLFAAKEGKNKDWCIAFHCYPADLYKTDIWSSHTYNPKSDSARFIDGYNLEILTGYVKKNFGTNHRIMLTEQGFTDKCGTDKQAACLVYTYYKAMFDDMVDVFHIMKFPGCGFELSEPAKTIWTYLEDGSDEHEQWIFDQVKGTIGVSSWTDIVPNWKSQSKLKKDSDDYQEENKTVFEGVDLSPVFDYNYYVANHPEVVACFTTDAKNNPPTFKQMFWYFTNYGMSMGHQAAAGFNVEDYKNSRPDLDQVFKGVNKEYYKYYCVTLKADENKVKDFVRRFYVTVLGRDAEEKGLMEWTVRLVMGENTGAEVARGFVMSQEFTGKQLDNTEFLNRMYTAFFNRQPDQGGFDTWMDLLEKGESREFVLAGFINSTEFKNLCDAYGIKQGRLDVPSSINNPKPNPNPDPNPNPNPSPDPKTGPTVDASNVTDEALTAYLTRFYQEVLGREPDAEGMETWKREIRSGDKYDAITAIRVGFFFSPEYLGKNKTDDEFIVDAYHAFLGRDPFDPEHPDPDGFNTWKSVLADGTYTREKLLDVGFGRSKEFRGILESYGFVFKEN